LKKAAVTSVESDLLQERNPIVMDRIAPPIVSCLYNPIFVFIVFLFKVEI